LSKLIGDGGGTRTFDQMYNDAGNVIPQSTIDGIRNSGQQLAGDSGAAFSQFAKNLFPEGGTNEFKKGNVIDTTETGRKLQELIANGFKTGTEMQEASRDKRSGDEKTAKSVLTSFSGSSSKVIADSLAKVGGGGGFLRAGMSLQERTAMQTAMATRQTAETLKAMQSEAKNNPAKPALLPR